MPGKLLTDAYMFNRAVCFVCVFLFSFLLCAENNIGQKLSVPVVLYVLHILQVSVFVSANIIIVFYSIQNAFIIKGMVLFRLLYLNSCCSVA
jgi:hypothetical protein